MRLHGPKRQKTFKMTKKVYMNQKTQILGNPFGSQPALKSHLKLTFTIIFVMDVNINYEKIKCKKSYFDQCWKWTAPKCWSKYTTPNVQICYFRRLACLDFGLIPNWVFFSLCSMSTIISHLLSNPKARLLIILKILIWWLLIQASRSPIRRFARIGEKPIFKKNY